ncbi:hypothetical protein ACIQGT_39885 [Streptomyces sp. NPDC093108]
MATAPLGRCPHGGVAAGKTRNPGLARPGRPQALRSGGLERKCEGVRL